MECESFNKSELILKKGKGLIKEVSPRSGKTPAVYVKA